MNSQDPTVTTFHVPSLEKPKSSPEHLHQAVEIVHDSYIEDNSTAVGQTAISGTPHEHRSASTLETEHVHETPTAALYRIGVNLRAMRTNALQDESGSEIDLRYESHSSNTNSGEAA